MTVTRCFSALWILTVIAVSAGSAAPWEPAAGDSAAQSLQQKRQRLAQRIAQLEEKEKSEADATDKQEEEPSADAQLLQSIDAVYLQQQTQLEQRSQLEGQVRDAEKQLERLDQYGPDEPKPYSFLLLEGLKDQQAAEKDRESAVKTDIKAAKWLWQTAHDELDESAKDAPAAKSTEDAPLSLELARAKVGLRETEIEVLNLRLGLSQARQKLLKKKIAAVEADVEFTAGDRDRQLQRLADQEVEWKRQRRTAQAGLQKVNTQKDEDLAETASDKTARDAVLSAWRITADAYQVQIVLLDQQLARLDDLRRFWRRRYRLASDDAEPKQVAKWSEELEEFQSQQADTTNSLEHRFEAARDEQAVLAQKAVRETSENVPEHWRSLEQQALQSLRELCMASLDEVKANERMLARFGQELEDQLKENPETWLASVRQSLNSLIGYSVAEGDNKSVTVGQLLLLVIYVTAGMLAAYFISRGLGRWVLQYLGLHPGTVTALRSIVFYVLCIIFGVAAFQFLHVPMTAFAFVGGAVAIAVGFGGQDIMKNFMSGVILLAEQPIRVGDVVQLAGVQGVVQHIGLRSTRLQTQSNHELIVPNHTLLDSSVTNLTLSDNFVQTMVTISVDRDVEVQKAKWDMQEIVFGHSMVMKSPRPMVLLTSVDSYWMTFEIHFWLEYSNYMRIAAVQSQILERVSDLFSPNLTATTETNEASESDQEASSTTEPSGEESADKTTPETAPTQPADSAPAKAPKRAAAASRPMAAAIKLMRRFGAGSKLPGMP